MNYRKAMLILRRLKGVEKDLTDDLKTFRWRLDSYKKNYWRQIVTDKNLMWRGWNYLYIFYLPHVGSGTLGIFVLVCVAVVILIIKLRLNKCQRIPKEQSVPGAL